MNQSSTSYMLGEERNPEHIVKSHASFIFKWLKTETQAVKRFVAVLVIQLNFIKRNIKYIEKMLDTFIDFPLSKKEQEQYWVLQVIYDQRLEMYQERKHKVNDRIVSIHQPHVRPISKRES